MAKTESTSSRNVKPLPRRLPYVLVKVDQDHIDRSMPERSSSCMIAESIKDLVPESTYVSVDLHTIRWSDPGKQCRYEYLTPRVAQIALLKFDRGIPVKPFEFRLRGGRIIRSYFGKSHRPARAERMAAAAARDEMESLAAEVAGESRPKGAKKRYVSQNVRRGKAELFDGRDARTPPVVVGGRPTPHFIRYGAVRKFGLRALLPNQLELEDA